MIKRVIAVSRPAYIRLERRQLVIDAETEELGRIPVEDIGVLILEHRQITITHAAMAHCLEMDAAVLVCDARHMPAAVLQPYEANSLHAMILREQVNITNATKARAWKFVVACKIRHQADVLDRLQRDSRHLTALAQRLKPGDPENHEAQAAKVYWKELFGANFRRRRSGNDVNTLLNYGYAILRAMVGRAICAAGLHPALGIHHTNQYNAFALADDLLEPLRPAVDFLVFKIREAADGSDELPLTRDRKRQLLALSARQCVVDGRQLPLMVAMQPYVASIREVLLKRKKIILFPQI